MEENLFENAPVRKAYFKFALPVVFSMIVTLIYNMADTYFIGQTGDANQVAAVSLCAPLYTLMIALGDIFGLGGSSVISRLFGQKRNDDAKRISSFCFYSAFFCGIIVTILMLVFSHSALKILGTDEATYVFASKYYKYIAFGAPFIIFSLAPSNIIRTEGLAKEVMVGSILGTVVNIILDPIFILVLNMGVSGAAIATVIGNIAADIFYIYIVLKRSKKLTIAFNKCRVNAGEMKDIFVIGVPAALTNIMQSIGIMAMNRSLYSYGNDKIAAMGIAMKVSMIVVLVLVGFSFGAQPLMGYNYGAGNKKRLKEVLKFSFIFQGILSIIMALILMVMAGYITAGFIGDKSIIESGALMLRIMLISTPLISVILLATVMFQSAGKAFPAMILSIGRQGVIFVPTVLILRRLFGYSGVIWSQTCADVITFILAMILFKITFKELFTHDN
ncbi:MATE family efflux transporter [Clostridium sp. SM-530-WT-3G]|uniref:MATE family efflux transporter n=1 Tax=Clostridium sp. SM-530-WT-3G TaxID=2725303 RepID=UPI00145F2689|nr:MATE family efflux transporter [Clostridium sp. SM-530-WT-3G]NME82364.1 MATE family efflux transporter [Clostridium sp. SM-530-WT-3G]